MIFIVGSSGRLGQALAAKYGHENAVCIERSVYESWGDEAAVPAIGAWFAEHITPDSVVYVCSGVLDARVPVDDLHRVNYGLPRNIINGVAQLDVRVVTFGTAMEGTLTTNPYVLSKLELARFVERRAPSACQVTHIRIHTLYGGGEPSPFMFLGLMLDAVRSQRPFLMTQGLQLREYHHVDDDATAIVHLVGAGVSGAVALSHGQPVTLRSLAESVFETLEQPELLRLGALPDPVEENFTHVFTPLPELRGCTFRETLPAVAFYIKSLANF